MGEPEAELVIGEPDPRLKPYVTGYQGYRMTGFEPGVHKGLPSKSLTFIVSFDDKLDVTPADGDHDDKPQFGSFWAMMAGLHAKPVTIRHNGSQHGVQLEITPLGISAFFGVRPGELVSTAVELDQISSQFSRILVERLNLGATWSERFAILDQMLLELVSPETKLRPQLDAAWKLIVASEGQVAIDRVASEVDWSRRHLSEQFALLYGMSPKLMANIVRFERAQRMLTSEQPPPLATIAAVCGYADQAHMTREWHRFAGASPRGWIEEEDLPFVQDPSTHRKENGLHEQRKS